jgi:lysophospholipase L1-like esterase
LRIILFSDSLGRPRPGLDPQERTEYEDVYGYRLRQKLADHYEVEIFYHVQLDSKKALALAEHQLGVRRPDLVVLHFGVNDCAPRIFKRDNRNIIFYPWFPKYPRQLILGFIRRYRRFLIQYVVRNRVYVSPNDFRQNLYKIQETVRAYSPHCQYLFLSIALTIHQLNHRSYTFNTNVAIYNSVARQVFGDYYIDINTLLGGNPETYLISDGIHLTKIAHAQIADHLYTRIDGLLERHKVTLG